MNQRRIKTVWLSGSRIADIPGFVKMTQFKYHNLRLMEPSLGPYRPAVPPERRLAVLMSGGVDSSVTAYLLKKAGWDVVGVTMKTPNACIPGEGNSGVDAARVCSQLGIAHYLVDVTEAFHDIVIGRFRDVYAAGKTPNPCVECNARLKLGLVWDLLEETFGIGRLATGHYARIAETPYGPALRRTASGAKDQSYFLYRIDRRRLGKFVLPLGDYTKAQVRAIAAEVGLSIAEKPESMELCFTGEADYRSILGAEADCPGDLTDMEGRVIGTHKGISHYTLGQRRGLGYAGGEPLYVGRIDPRENTVAIGTRDEVSRRRVRAAEYNVHLPDVLQPAARLSAKIRSYGPPQPCTVTDVSPDKVVVEFDEPQFAPAPGQSLVLYYADEYVAGGGVIV